MTAGTTFSIALVEPFMGGSHQQWAEAVQNHSRHHVRIFSLPGRYWKWRMHGGAVELANAFLKSGYRPDLILATDMLDLTGFLALTREVTAGIPAALYFHENQLTYPWSADDPDLRSGRDNHYAFINYASALAADRVIFNSHYHRSSFLGALPAFLRQFPDHRGLDQVDVIQQKSDVFPLMLDLSRFDARASEQDETAPCTFLWNHRWEYDKNPESFFRLMFRLKTEGHAFRLIVLGEQFGRVPACFKEAREQLREEIIHWGYADDFDTYARLLWQADVLPVTSNQDFFGASIMEAVYCRTMPLLPDRLAYPEHLPDNLRDQCLYHSENELLDKCAQAIREIDRVRRDSFQPLAARYDAGRRIGEFDALLCNEIRNNSGI